MPTYLSTFTDVNTTGTVRRITNVVGRRHFYARYPAWNFDGSLLYIGASGSDRMINGTTYVDIGAFSGMSNSVLCWTSNRLYGVDGGGDRVLYTQTFNSSGASTGITTKHLFAVGYTVWIGGDSASWEGGISNDDRFICVTLTDVSHGGGDRLQVYDTVLDSIVGDMAKPVSMDNAQISQLGNYVVVVANGETRVWPRDLSGSGTQLFPSARHGDNCLNAAGEEIFVTNTRVVASTDTGVYSARLSDGLLTQLLAAGTAFEYGHVSGRAIDRPGWVYLSVYDYTSTSGRGGRDQVIAVKTDGSGIVNWFCWSMNRTNGGTYSAQPHAVPSRDGRKVLFASTWGLTDVYDYVVNF